MALYACLEERRRTMGSNPTAFDAHKAEAFAGRLLGALNEGAFCLMVSIGHRTGLFDAMRDQPPLTSEELAARAELKERYVREWLGAMVTAGAVDVEAQALRYSLPPEHAAFLTRQAKADNVSGLGALADVRTLRSPKVERWPS